MYRHKNTMVVTYNQRRTMAGYQSVFYRSADKGKEMVLDRLHSPIFSRQSSKTNYGMEPSEKQEKRKGKVYMMKAVEWYLEAVNST